MRKTNVKSRFFLIFLLVYADGIQKKKHTDPDSEHCLKGYRIQIHFFFIKTSTSPGNPVRLVQNGGHLVAINKSRYYKRDDGLAIGTGAFVAALGKRRLLLHCDSTFRSCLKQNTRTEKARSVQFQYFFAGFRIRSMDPH